MVPDHFVFRNFCNSIFKNKKIEIYLNFIIIKLIKVHDRHFHTLSHSQLSENKEKN